MLLLAWVEAGVVSRGDVEPGKSGINSEFCFQVALSMKEG